MGGFSIHYEKYSEDPFFLNLPTRNIWLRILKDANQLKELSENTNCGRDYDGECSRNGCLQKNNSEMKVKKETLIKANKTSIQYLKKHKNWKGRASGKWVNGKTDWEVALKILKDMLNFLGKSTGEYIFILDNLTCDFAYPCPRYLPIKKGNKKVHIMGKKLDYETARKMYANGEWNKICSDFYKS